MDQKLISLLDKLSKEIFHEENFHAVPSAKRIKAAMAEVNKFTSRNLTSQCSRPDNACPNYHESARTQGWFRCGYCGKDLSGG